MLIHELFFTHLYEPSVFRHLYRKSNCESQPYFHLRPCKTFHLYSNQFDKYIYTSPLYLCSQRAIARMYSEFAFVNIQAVFSLVTMVTFARVGTNDLYTVRMLWAGIIASFKLIKI